MEFGAIIFNILLFRLLSYLIDNCYIDRIKNVCNRTNKAKFHAKGLHARVEENLSYILIDIKKLAENTNNVNTDISVDETN